jgi:hypothetical protein
MSDVADLGPVELKDQPTPARVFKVALAWQNCLPCHVRFRSVGANSNRPERMQMNRFERMRNSPIATIAIAVRFDRIVLAIGNMEAAVKLYERPLGFERELFSRVGRAAPLYTAVRRSKDQPSEPRCRYVEQSSGADTRLGRLLHDRGGPGRSGPRAYAR